MFEGDRKNTGYFSQDGSIASLCSGARLMRPSGSAKDSVME
jgi:hypothetical protein